METTQREMAVHHLHLLVLVPDVLLQKNLQSDVHLEALIDMRHIIRKIEVDQKHLSRISYILFNILLYTAKVQHSINNPFHRFLVNPLHPILMDYFHKYIS